VSAYDGFAPIYDVWAADMTEDVDFYVSLAEEADGPIVELAVGTDNGPSLSLWWVGRGEWEGLLEVSGLETEALYGSFDRGPFDEESREFVWVARKPA
jgi:hypothetical protein